MTDRELLELAAKAAGVFLTPQTMAEVFPGFEWNECDWTIFTDHGAEGTVAWKGEDGKPAGTARKHWNPLTDDGDALRLAVELGMLNEGMPNAVSLQWELSQRGDPDPCAATRRAIVRAAAAIGQSMEGKK